MYNRKYTKNQFFVIKAVRTLPSMGGLEGSDAAHELNKNRAFFLHPLEKYKIKPAVVFLKIQKLDLSWP